MKKMQCVFQRYEKKYVMTKTQYDGLLEKIAPYMELDAYGKHTICNIYYDTESYELIRTSIEKPSYKEKLRIRSYGVADKDSNVFLELKKKVNGIVYKRRVCMNYQDAMKYLESRYVPVKSQILKEIDWFLDWYHPTEKIFIAYDRMAYIGKENENLRMTFDFAIRWRKEQVDLTAGDYGEEILKDDEVLMEIKIPMAMPVWMSDVLNELEIFPVSFSKYGVCYKEHLFDQIRIGG